MRIPKTNKAIVLPEYNTNLIRAMRSLRLEDTAVREPGMDEVLIKVTASPCNPSDIAFIQGAYNVVKSLPAIPGFEGTGMVVEVGNSAEARQLAGKKVSFFSQDDKGGAWAQFATVKARHCITLKKDLPPEQAACLFINPMTAYALFDIIRRKKANCVIVNAAAGQIGVFLQKLLRDTGITIINIVRKDKHIAYLKSLGEKIVINQAAEDFETTLWVLSEELAPGLALDAIGGDMTGKLLNNMPERSEIILYGGLSGQQVGGINPLGLIFDGKKVSGFNLNYWLGKQSRKRIEEISLILQDMIIKQEIRTRVQLKARLEDFEQAMMQYIRNMSDGKVLLFPWNHITHPSG